MATIVTTRGLLANIGGIQKSIKTLYDNIGGSRKTISKAYANIGGSRKQIHPSATKTVYQYRRYSVNKYTSSSMYVGGYVDEIYMNNCYTSYSFNTSTGKFTLSGSGSSYFEEYESQRTGNTEYRATRTLYAYHPYSSNRVILIIDSFQEGDAYDGVKAMAAQALYASGSGYSSSYTTIDSSSQMSTGYVYDHCSTYDSGTNEISYEIPYSSGYYYVEI